MAELSKSDLEFILQQILIAEAHAAGGDLLSMLPSAFAPFGLRTVDGSFNNLIPGQSEFGAADNSFPTLLDPVFRNDQDGDTFGQVTNTNYATTTSVVDADPRIISNLIVDQTANNPAAVIANGGAISPSLATALTRPTPRPSHHGQAPGLPLPLSFPTGRPHAPHDDSPAASSSSSRQRWQIGASDWASHWQTAHAGG